MSYRQITSIKKPAGGVHYQYEREPDGQLKSHTVWSAYPSEILSLLEGAIQRDKGRTVPAQRPFGFFGKWNYSPSDGKPEPVVFVDDFKSQPDTDNFERAKNSGAIVMNTAQLYKCKLKWLPVEKPAGNTVPNGYFSLDKRDFKGLTEIFPESNNLVKLSNGNWYDPSSFGMWQEIVPQSTWSLPFVDFQKLKGKLFSFEQDGGLVTKAAANLNEATLDILTELAEMPDTIRMARDTLKLFSNKGKKLKKLITQISQDSGSPAGLVRIGDKVASARLQYRYGILPLKYTFDDIKSVMDESFKRKYCAGQSRKSVAEVPDLEDLLGPGSFSGSFNQDHRAFFKRRLDPDSSLDQFQNVFSVNIPKTVWELTPWSLVVDWFVNVGDYLTAINPMPSMEEKGCYSVRTSAVGKYITEDGNILEINLDYYNRSFLNRVVDSSLQLDPVFTTDRAIDAFAFAWQIVRGKIKKLKK